MLYGFREQEARILKRLARTTGLHSSPGTKVKYPKPLPEDGLYLKLGKPDANIAKGATGTVSIWEDDASSDTGTNQTCKALGAAVTSGKWVTVWRLGTTYYVGCWES